MISLRMLPLLAFLLVQLFYSREAASAPGTLSGIVKDRNTTQPLAGAWVFLDEKSTNKLPIHDSVQADSSGSYRFSGLEPVTQIAFGFNVRAKMARYGVYVTPLIQVQSSEDKRVDLELEKIVALTVVVADSADPGTPLEGTHVALTVALSGEADERGRVRFAGLRPGGLGLTVAAPGYRTRYLGDSLESRAFEESVTVRLEREAPGASKTILGVKKTPSGKIVQGEQVHFLCAAPEADYILYDAEWKRFPFPGQDTGAFAIQGIPAACQRGMLRTRSDTASVELTGSETRLAFIIKEPPGSLSISRRHGIRAAGEASFDGDARDLLGRRESGDHKSGAKAKRGRIRVSP